MNSRGMSKLNRSIERGVSKRGQCCRVVRRGKVRSPENSLLCVFGQASPAPTDKITILSLPLQSARNIFRPNADRIERLMPAHSLCCIILSFHQTDFCVQLKIIDSIFALQITIFIFFGRTFLKTRVIEQKIGKGLTVCLLITQYFTTAVHQ